MKRYLIMCLAACGIIAGAVARSDAAGRLVNGVLTVDGKPFYPLGSWNFSYTTPEDIARLGMNTSYRGGPSTPEAVEQFRTFMRRCAELGVQMVPYLSYGGGSVAPWPPESVRAIAKLATEPNLLAWYVGDDITMRHLDGIRQTVSILREQTPTIPTAADYIATQTPEAKTVFTQYVDIRCQYAYPIPNDSIRTYLRFFDDQRRFVGDPLWTWVQNFMWGSTARMFGLGIEDGPGPVPAPEQVRLLAYSAINRGVRGLLFFPHHELHLQPELAAEVALVCREVRLFNDHLAAGTFTLDLPASDPDLKATAFRYGSSTVVSAMLARGTYHRWIDEAVVRDVTIDVPWEGRTLPQALLVDMPDLVECRVAPGAQPGTVGLVIPRFELAGFILLSNDPAEIARLRRGVADAAVVLQEVAVAGSIAQVRAASDALWRVGFGHLYDQETMMQPANRANEELVKAFAARRATDEIRLWRTALRSCRASTDSLMRFAEARRNLVPANQQRYLQVPAGLYMIRSLKNAPAADDPWHFVREWLIAGPFPLEQDTANPTAVPPGFERAYPPETDLAPNAQFTTVDGPGGWKRAEADISALLDFLPYIGTTDDVVTYAQCRVIAPREMDVTASLGSNDGARVWLNGAVVFSWPSEPTGGRTATPHQDEIPMHLNAGENTVLVKVENLGLNWQLYLSFRDPDRVLRYELPR